MKRFLSLLLALALSTMAVPAFALEPTNADQTAKPSLEQALPENPDDKSQSGDESDDSEPSNNPMEAPSATNGQAGDTPSNSVGEPNQTAASTEEDLIATQATEDSNGSAEIDGVYGDFSVHVIAYNADIENPEEMLRSTLSFENGKLIIGNSSQTVSYDETYSVRMKEGVSQTTNSIEIRTPSLENSYGCDAYVMLDNVNIETGLLSLTPAIRIAEGAGAVELFAKGESTLTSGMSCAGIQKDNSAKGEAGTLTLSGYEDSALKATGGSYAAGIGSGQSKDGDSFVQNIVINTAGTVEATGGQEGGGGAGIGSAKTNDGDSKASYITIKNGTVKATGGHAAPGIGSGEATSPARSVDGKETSEAGFITIEGGNVQAQGGGYASGIGSGVSVYGDSWAHDITVNNGTVNAAGGVTAAGIGSAWARASSHVNDIKIFGGNVAATGGNGGTGIGSGFAEEGDSLARFITLSGGTIEAQGGKSEHSFTGEDENIIGAGVGIGSGWAETSNSAANDITISGTAKVTARAGNDTGSVSGAPGVGSGWAKAGKSTLENLKIRNGQLEAYGSASAAPGQSEPTQLPAIGTGYGALGSTVTKSSISPDKNYTAKIYRAATPEQCGTPELVSSFSDEIFADRWEYAYAKVCVTRAADLIVSGGESFRDYDGTVVLTQSTTYTVTATEGVSFYGLRVAQGASPTVILDEVNIDVSAFQGRAAILISADAGKVTLYAEGENTLSSGFKSAGIQKDNSAKGEDGELTISGDEDSILKVMGGSYAAGIGSAPDNTGDSFVQNITIDTYGTIEATGGDNGGAGIGSSRTNIGASKASYITIKNGTIKATGGLGASGIGSGSAGASDDGVVRSGDTSEAGFITIEGGNIQAQGGYSAPGIGSGASVNKDSWAHDLTITGGTISAMGGVRSAGIGSSEASTSSHVNDIKISGGTVAATGGYGCAGIGSGLSEGDSLARFITLSGGTIEAVGGESKRTGSGEHETTLAAGVGIGSSWAKTGNSTANDITISGTAKVVAKAGSDTASVSGAPGVGSGCAKAGTSSVENVKITNGQLEAYGSSSVTPSQSAPAQLPAISTGYGASGSTVTSSFVAPDETFVANVSRGASPEDCTSTSVASDSPLSIGGEDWTGAYVKVRVIPAPNLVVTGGETTADEDGTVVLSQSVTYTVSSNADASRNGLRVAAGVSPTVVLDGASIDVSAFSGRAALLIPADAGAVTLKLKGENILKSGANVAGIQKDTNSDAELLITSANGAGSTEGKLAVTGGWGGAGIGSGYANEGDSVADGIRITGGTISANSGSNASGIGAGYSLAGTSNAMNITIEGGIITASSISTRTNGAWAAGIGSGKGANSTASGITITGGTVKATGGRNGCGAGIGSGYAEGSIDNNQGISSAMNILVSGGSVEAYSSNGAAALGSGRGDVQSIASGITITGGNVVAQASAVTSGWNNVGIGSGAAGNEPHDGDISRYALSGSTVSPGYSKASNIVISGGTVTAAGTNGGSAIGSGNVVQGGTTITEAISITGGTVEATSGSGGWDAKKCTYSAPAFGPSEVINTGDNPAMVVFPESIQIKAAKSGQLLDVWKGTSAESAQHVVAGSASPYALADHDAYVKAAFADPVVPSNPGDMPDAKQPSQANPETLAATGDSLLPLGAITAIALASLVVALAARKRKNRS